MRYFVIFNLLILCASSEINLIRQNDQKGFGSKLIEPLLCNQILEYWQQLNNISLVHHIVKRNPPVIQTPNVEFFRASPKSKFEIKHVIDRPADGTSFVDWYKDFSQPGKLKEKVFEISRQLYNYQDVVPSMKDVNKKSEKMFNTPQTTSTSNPPDIGSGSQKTHHHSVTMIDTDMTTLQRDFYARKIQKNGKGDYWKGIKANEREFFTNDAYNVVQISVSYAVDPVDGITGVHIETQALEKVHLSLAEKDGQINHFEWARSSTDPPDRTLTSIEAGEFKFPKPQPIENTATRTDFVTLDDIAKNDVIKGELRKKLPKNVNKKKGYFVFEKSDVEKLVSTIDTETGGEFRIKETLTDTTMNAKPKPPTDDNQIPNKPNSETKKPEINPDSPDGKKPSHLPDDDNKVTQPKPTDDTKNSDGTDSGSKKHHRPDDDDSQLASKFCKLGGQGRRRRGADSCAFVYKKKKDKNKFTQTDIDDIYSSTGSKKKSGYKKRYSADDIVEIRSDKLVSAYSKAGEKNRRRLTLLAQNQKQKLTGDSKSLHKTKKLFAYENLQKHNTQITHATNSLKTGSFVSEGPRTSHFRDVDLLKDAKISPTETTVSFAKKKSSFSKGFSKLEKGYGYVFLAKGLVTALKNRDETSLTIIGGQVGLNAVSKLEKFGKFASKHSRTTQKLVLKTFGKQVGTKIFKSAGVRVAAKKVTKSLVFLGKAAGPLSFLADIGLGCWSLSSSIQMYNNPNLTKYQQNEALANVVDSSLSITLGVVAMGISLAFPLAAPVVAVVSFVVGVVQAIGFGIYKAVNHVDSLNSQILLLGYEKANEGLNAFFGQDTSSYIQDLIGVKTANNLIVGAYEDILESNPDIIGYIFPSRVLDDYEACNLTRQHCTFKIMMFCGKWEEVQFHRSGCDKSDNDVKELYGGIAGKLVGGVDLYECVCENRTSWGLEKLDSTVDLREKQIVYKERSIPDSNKEKYFTFCVPSSKTFLGDQISKQDSEYDFLCVNAIGVKRISGEGKVMIYELGKGHDEIYLDSADLTSNIFRIDDGTKSFFGGAGNETFDVIGNCTKGLNGVLDGAGGENVLILGKDCLADDTLWVNLNSVNGQMKDSNKIVDLQLKGFQILYGRSSMPEKVTCDCKTKYIKANGGKSESDLDEIIVPKNDDCNYALVVEANSFTQITNWATQGNFQVIILAEPNSYFSGRNMVPSKTTYDVRMAPYNLISISCSKSTLEKESYKVDLKMTSDQNAEFEFYQLTPENAKEVVEKEEFLAEPNIIISESPTNGVNSKILIHKTNGNCEIVHYLNNFESEEMREFKAVQNVPNLFYIKGGNWEIYGGENDVFCLFTLNFAGEIVGGTSTSTLMLDESIEAPSLTINLQSGLIQDSNVPNSNIVVKNINSVVGRLDKTDLITFICQKRASLIDGKGGGSLKQPDIITILEDDKCNYNLTIHSTKFTQIDNFATSGFFTYFIIQHSNVNFNVQFNVASEMIDHVFYIAIPVYYLSSGETSTTGDTVTLNLRLQKSQNLLFQFKSSEENKDAEGFFVKPVIVFQDENNEEEGRVAIQSKTGNLHIEHSLVNPTASKKQRRGAEGVQNIFRIVKGAWDVTGGISDDVFLLASFSTSGSIDGKLGVNTLVLSETIISSKIILNLEEKSLTDENDLKLRVENVQIVVGRVGKADEVYCACSTTSVNSGGGAPEVDFMDRIFIPHITGCKMQRMLINVQAFTQVVNSAKTGNYVYVIERENECSNIEMKHFSDITHVLQFKFGFSNMESVSFNTETSLLSLKTKLGAKCSYRMESPGQTEHFTNPQLIFMEMNDEIAVVTGNVRASLAGVVQADIRVVGSFAGTISGLNGADNSFFVDADNFIVSKIAGGNRNNFITISNVKSIDFLEGSAEFSRSGNKLKLADNFLHRKRLTVDLDWKNGYIAHSEDLDSLVVRKLNHVNEFQGRVDSFDRVFIDCNTRVVSDAEEIYVINRKCPNYQTKFTITAATNVYFWTDPEETNILMDEDLFEGGTFYYEFTELCSFNISVENWYVLDYTQHLYLLNFTIFDLEKIEFSPFESVLTYVIGKQSYYHTVNPFMVNDEQFYTHPNFYSRDGFEIKIYTDGSILFTYGKIENMTMDDATKLIPQYESLANKLKVNVIITTTTDFLYFGYNGTMGEDTNLLTNAQIRSHLIGGGGSNVVYFILDSPFDVYIYPGVNEHSDEKQIIDLSNMVLQIRNLTQKKYVPTIQEKGEDLLILMENFEHMFPMKIFVKSGTKYNTQLQVLLSSVPMSISLVSATPEENGPIISKRNTRSSPGEFKLLPTSIIIEEGTMTLLAASDLEEGQIIISKMNSNNPTKRTLDSDNEIDQNSKFSMALLENEMIFSNLAASDDLENVMTLVIYDRFKESENNGETQSELGQFKNVKIEMGDRVVEDINKVTREELEFWEDILAKKEEELLKDLPEINRKYEPKTPVVIPTANLKWVCFDTTPLHPWPVAHNWMKFPCGYSYGSYPANGLPFGPIDGMKSLLKPLTPNGSPYGTVIIPNGFQFGESSESTSNQPLLKPHVRNASIESLPTNDSNVTLGRNIPQMESTAPNESLLKPLKLPTANDSI